MDRARGVAGEPVTATPPSGDDLRGAVEAILLVVDEPVSDVTLAQILERPRAEICDVLAELADDSIAAPRLEFARSRAVAVHPPRTPRSSNGSFSTGSRRGSRRRRSKRSRSWRIGSPSAEPACQPSVR